MFYCLILLLLSSKLPGYEMINTDWRVSGDSLCGRWKEGLVLCRHLENMVEDLLNAQYFS